MQLRTQAEDNGRSFICEANNGLGVTLVANVTLSVMRESWSLLSLSVELWC